MGIHNTLSGTLTVSLTSAEPEDALGYIIRSGIAITQVQQMDSLTYRFSVRRTDYGALVKLCTARGDKLTVLTRLGLYWTGKQLLRRPVLLGGILLLVTLILFLPSRVLFVRVDGNQTVPSNLILDAARESGIRFGASRRLVRSEQVKNALLAAVPQLQWAGVNTSGCVATISVQERSVPENSVPEHQVTSIVAARDGYILSGTAIRGNALFRPGQTVREGEVLISGYTDCGLCIQATQAEGEILAQTRRSLTVVTPTQASFRTEIQRTKKNYSLLLGKKRINFWKDSGNVSPGCGRMYQEYYATLPGGFTLPIALCVDTVSFYDTVPWEIPQTEAEASLHSFAGNYLSGQMVAGQILNRSEIVFPMDGFYQLEGEYVCKEMIGRVRKEQMGDIHGKDS